MHGSHSLDAFVDMWSPSHHHRACTQETLPIVLWLAQTSLQDESRICDLVSFWDVCSLNFASKHTNNSFGLQDRVLRSQRDQMDP